MSQVSSQPGMSEKIRRLGPDNLAVRGNLYAFVSPSQSQTLVQNHFDVCSLTIGQMLTSNPTNLRRRSIEDDAKTCSICFEKISDATGYWNTLCSHS